MRKPGFAITLVALCMLIGISIFIGCDKEQTTSIPDVELGTMAVINPGGIHNAAVRAGLNATRNQVPEHLATITIVDMANWEYTEVRPHIERCDADLSQVSKALHQYEKDGQLSPLQKTLLYQLLSAYQDQDAEQIEQSLRALHIRQRSETYDALVSIADSSYALAQELRTNSNNHLDVFDWYQYGYHDLVGGVIGGMSGGPIGLVGGAAGASLLNAYDQFY